MNDNRKYYMSICSGVDAPALVFPNHGYEPCAFAEIEPFPKAVLKYRYPNIPDLDDITKIEGDEHHAYNRESGTNVAFPNGKLDLLIGGTPCQDMSIAGKRAGMRQGSGTRSSLSHVFIGLAFSFKVETILWENVYGCLSSGHGEDFAEFLSNIVGWRVAVPDGGWRNSGCVDCAPGCYGVAWRTLDVQFTRTTAFPFAIPQRRRRVFLIGYAGDARRAAEVLLESEVLPWSAPQRFKTRERLAGSAGTRLVPQNLRTEESGHGRNGLGYAACDVHDGNLPERTGEEERKAEECGRGNGTAGRGDGRDSGRDDGRDSGIYTFNFELIDGGRELSPTLSANRTRDLMVYSIGSLQLHEACAPSEEVSQTCCATCNWGGQSHIIERMSSKGEQVFPTLSRINFSRLGNKSMYDGSFIVESVSWWNGEQVSETLATTTMSQRMPDKSRLPCVIENVLCYNIDGKFQKMTYTCYDNQTYARNPDDTGDICATILSRCGMGGNTCPLIVSTYEHHPSDGCAIDKNYSATLSANGTDDSGCSVLIVAIDGDKMCKRERKGGSGIGWHTDNVCYTLTHKDVHAVAYSYDWIGSDRYNQCASTGVPTTLKTPVCSDDIACVYGMSFDELFGFPVLPDVSFTCVVQNSPGFHNGCVVKFANHCRTFYTVRRITPVEAERLMGFPDNYTKIPWHGKTADKCPDSHRYKACGNSIGTNCLDWIAERMEIVDHRYKVYEESLETIKPKRRKASR